MFGGDNLLLFKNSLNNSKILLDLEFVSKFLVQGKKQILYQWKWCCKLLLWNVNFVWGWEDMDFDVIKFFP